MDHKDAIDIAERAAESNNPMIIFMLGAGFTCVGVYFLFKLIITKLNERGASNRDDSQEPRRRLFTPARMLSEDSVSAVRDGIKKTVEQSLIEGIGEFTTAVKEMPNNMRKAANDPELTNAILDLKSEIGNMVHEQRQYRELHGSMLDAMSKTVGVVRIQNDHLKKQNKNILEQGADISKNITELSREMLAVLGDENA